MPAHTSPAVALACDLLDEAREHDARVTAHDSIVTVTIRFTPGDTVAYMAAEHACHQILRHARTVSSGSTWGTDSASIGGYVGLEKGYCTLNKSGVGRLLVRALKQAGC